MKRSPVFNSAFTGFHLMDAASGRVVGAVNADQYFMPASNTKILTLATCLAVLGDSLPGLEYQPIQEEGDPRITVGYCFRGTGDPTFLHPDFQAWQPAFTFLETSDMLVYESGRLQDTRFGPGWAWDDYNDDYSQERSALPIYGNQVRLLKQPVGWTVLPGYYTGLLGVREDYRVGDKRIYRDEQTDTVRLPYYHNENFQPGFQLDIPLRMSDSRLLELLADTLKPELPLMSVEHCTSDWQVLYSVPADTVYRRLMYQSDNFIAEQLLLLCAGVKFDTLRQRDIIRWAKDSLFTGFPRPPRWVDGSGLSRYNLITPRYLTSVLQQLYRTQPRERLFSLFPAGGKSGTLEGWYGGPDGNAYIIAKTGSMSGVHCLSGYLLAESGRVYIFSFMHNNFVGSNAVWKKEMERILLKIRKKG